MARVGAASSSIAVTAVVEAACPTRKARGTFNPDKSGLVPVGSLPVESEGAVVQLRGFGLVRLFQKRDAKGQVEHWASSDCEMTAEMTAETWAQLARAC